MRRMMRLSQYVVGTAYAAVAANACSSSTSSGGGAGTGHGSGTTTVNCYVRAGLEGLCSPSIPDVQFWHCDPAPTIDKLGCETTVGYCCPAGTDPSQLPDVDPQGACQPEGGPCASSGSSPTCCPGLSCDGARCSTAPACFEVGQTCNTSTGGPTGGCCAGEGCEHSTCCVGPRGACQVTTDCCGGSGASPVTLCQNSSCCRTSGADCTSFPCCEGLTCTVKYCSASDGSTYQCGATCR